MSTINREKLEKVLEQEIQMFAREHPKCYALYQRAKGCLLDGVPMNWMVRWAGGFPLFVEHAKGAHFTCADGKEFLDFCLGDTGAMVGHSPDAPVAEIKKQLDKGITFMLPTEDAIWVGEELQKRFKLKYWQTTLTATDANRFALRLCRHITKRPMCWSMIIAITALLTRPSSPSMMVFPDPALGRSDHRSTLWLPPESFHGTTSRRWNKPSPPVTSLACWRSR